jgi:probable phosphoglycerate mutase
VKLILIRHGESTWNAEGRYQGRLDAPLSERGKAQARALAEHLVKAEDVRPRAIASSPLSRARDTAEATAHLLRVGVAVDADLVEISHGQWEGLLKTEIAERWPEMLGAWRTAPETVRFPGGESLADVKRRWHEFLTRVNRWASPLMIVTHDVIVRLAVLDARGEPLSAFNSLTSENAAITELDYHSGQLSIVRLNERSHLGSLHIDPSAQAL